MFTGSGKNLPVACICFPPCCAGKNVKYLTGQKLKVSLKIFRNQDVPKDKSNMKHPPGTGLRYALESLTHPWVHSLFWPGSMGTKARYEQVVKNVPVSLVTVEQSSGTVQGIVSLSHVLIGSVKLLRLWCGRVLLLSKLRLTVSSMSLS